MKGIDIHGALFETLFDHARAGPLRLNYFSHEDATPHVHDRFIGAWGMFPYHDYVPLYFSKHIYCKFLLHMCSDYTSIPSPFYGSNRGHSYDHPGACRDPAFVPPPSGLMPTPRQRIIFPIELADPS